MKKAATIIIFIVTALLNASGQDANQKPYDIKSGIVEYGFYGDKVGKGTLWFDDYGMKSAMYTEITVKGQTTKEWIVINGDYQSSWNPANTSSGIRIKNPVLAWSVGASGHETISYTESVYIKLGMKRYGNEKYLNRACLAFKGNIGKLVTWHGILMLLDLKTDGSLTHQAAKSVQTNVKIDPKYFVIPRNIKFTDK